LKPFTLLQSIREAVFREKSKLAGDTQGLMANLEATYAKLVPVAESISTNIKNAIEKVDTLFQLLPAVHNDVNRFFQAARALSELCRAVETKVIAAYRVKSLCMHIETAVGLFEGLLARLEVQADPSSGVSELLKVYPKLPEPVEVTFNFLSTVICVGISALLNKYFKLSDLKETMASLKTDLDVSPSADVVLLEQALEQLIPFVATKKLAPYPASTNPEAPVPRFQILNPLMDDNSANTLSDTLQNVVGLAKNIKLQDGAALFPDLNKSLDPTSVRASENLLKNMYLLTWAQAWDKAEPIHPSQVFLRWYSLLECLDGLIKKRKNWQRLDKDAPLPQAAPVSLASSALTLWQKLEEKATVGGSQYNLAIITPLQKPLHERIDQLLGGLVQLPPSSAATDILKILPPSKEGQVTTAYEVPQSAQDLVASAFADSKVPEALSSINANQASFEEVAADLRPLLASAGGIYASSNLPPDAGVKAINDLHDDYNLIVATKLLELTNDQLKAKKYVELVGSEGKLN
jgi:hypothetical protein